MNTGGTYNDYVSTQDSGTIGYFPYEPEGDIYPYYEKKITEAWSLPSTDGNGTFYPSERSTFTDGFNPNAGDWEVSGIGMNDTTYQIFKTFSETLPPNHYFLFHKNRLNLTYIVEIAKFRGVWNREFMWWEYTMKLLNKGVVT